MLTFKQFLIEEESARMQYFDLSPQTKERYEQDRQKEKERRQRQNLPPDADLDIPFEDRVQLLKRQIERDLTKPIKWGGSEMARDLEDETHYFTQFPQAPNPQTSSLENLWNRANSWVSKELELAKDTAKQAYERMHFNSSDVRLPSNIQSKDEREAGVRYRSSSEDNRKIDKYYEKYLDKYPERFGQAQTDGPFQEPQSINIMGFSSLFSPEEMEKGIPMSSGYDESRPEARSTTAQGWWHPYGLVRNVIMGAQRGRGNLHPGWAGDVGITPMYKFNQSTYPPSWWWEQLEKNTNPIEAYVNTEDLEKFKEWKKYYTDLPDAIEGEGTDPWRSPNSKRYAP